MGRMGGMADTPSIASTEHTKDELNWKAKRLIPGMVRNYKFGFDTSDTLVLANPKRCTWSFAVRI